MWGWEVIHSKGSSELVVKITLKRFLSCIPDSYDIRGFMTQLKSWSPKLLSVLPCHPS